VHNESDTIVALATPAGRSALAVIRMAGPAAFHLARKCLPGLGSSVPPRTPHLRTFHDSRGTSVDRVMVTLFAAPDTYTGDDLVEISCHGSPPVIRTLISTLIAIGARLARPGEFTERAFLNGKMDLAQAEAVRDLIESQTAFQAKIAAEQLEGRLSLALQPLREELVRIISHMETALEFVEDDVTPAGRAQLTSSLGGVDGRLEDFLRTFEFGQLMHDGAVVTIVGRPNAGKSSLFNALLRSDRAIVTEIPGTTRDALTETIDIAGIPVQLVDTAGIRPSTDRLEALGIQKSISYVGRSHLVLFVLDGSSPFAPADREVWQNVRGVRYLVVVNKSDLPQVLETPAELREGSAGELAVSALTGSRLEPLRELIREALVRPGDVPEGESPIITNVRHRDCLLRTRGHIGRATEASASGLSEEFVIHDLRLSLQALGEITGETTVEDILESIFSTFCIGK